MEKRYVIIAVVIVIGVLAVLSYRPADDDRMPTDRPRPSDRIVELPQAPEDDPIATVELDAPPPEADQPAGAGADAGMIRRFEQESVDPAWARIAGERLATGFVPEVERRGGTVAGIECRQTACRVRMEFADAARRPAAVSELMTLLAEDRHVALIERVDDNRVTLLVAP